MYDKLSGITIMNSNKGNGKNIRGGGSRHLSNKKNRNAFGFAGSNSQNWRESSKPNNVVELNTNAYKNHHLTSAFVSLIGLPVEIQKTDGHVYEGILESVSDKLEFHLCYALQKANASTTSNFKETNGNTNELVEKLMFPFSDIVRCVSKNVDVDYAKRSHLMTDTAISGGDGGVQERELVQWKPDHADKVNDSLETLEMANMNGSGGWEFDDMIRQNEEKHGVTSTFDISMSNYMTPMEITDDEEYRQIERLAEKTAREMQKDHRHKELENMDSGMNEEELFSSVVRPQQNSNSGTSPHINNSNTYNNNNNNANYSSNRSSNYKVNARGNKSNITGPRFRQRHQDDPPNRHTQGPSNRTPNGVSARHQQNNASMHHGNPATVQPYHNIPSYSAAAKRHPPNINQPPRIANQQQKAYDAQLTHETDNTFQHTPRVVTQEQLSQAKQQYWEKPKQSTNTSMQQSSSTSVTPSTIQNNAPIVSSVAPLTDTAPPSVTQAIRQSIATPNRALSSETLKHTSPLRSNPLEKKVLPEQKPDVMPGLPSKERGDLMKYGKLNKTEDEKKLVSIDDLKEFKDTFKLDSKATKKVSQQKSIESPSSIPPHTTSTTIGEFKNSSKTAQVTEAPIVQVSAVQTNTTKPSPIVDGIVTTTSHTAPNKSPPLSTTTAATSFATTVPAVSTFTMTNATTTSSTMKSTLNPSAKAFNPNTKEFTPGGKSLPKVHSYVEPYPHGQQQPGPSPFHPQQSVIMSTGQQHLPEIHAQYIQPQVRQMYERHFRSMPGAVYEVPNTNQMMSNQTPHPGGYIHQQQQQQQQQQHHRQQQQQQQQQQVFLLQPQNGNMYPQPPQPVMPGHQGQSFLPVQQVSAPMLRLVHGPSQPVPQQRIPHAGFQSDVPGGYILHGNQHSNPQAHQAVGGNYQSALSSPAGTPHMQQPPYHVNAQVNTNQYPQHMSPQIHTQGKGEHYQPRPTYPTNTHPQQPVFMVQGVPYKVYQ